MGTRMVAVAAVLGAGAGWAERAAAQETRVPAPEAVAPAAQAPQAAPVVTTSRLGPSALGAELLLPAPVRTPADERPLVHTPAYQHAPGLALMIAGGAAFLGGAIIGGDPGTALMVGGVIVGAVGLYQYLQ